MLIYTCQNLPKIYQTIRNFSPWSHNLSLQSGSHYYPLYQLTSITSITIYHYLYIVSTTMYNTIGHEPIVQNNKFISVILTSYSNFSIFCVSSLFYIKNKKTKVMDKSKQKTRKNCNKLVETLAKLRWKSWYLSGLLTTFDATTFDTHLICIYTSIHILSYMPYLWVILFIMILLLLPHSFFIKYLAACVIQNRKLL